MLKKANTCLFIVLTVSFLLFSAAYSYGVGPLESTYKNTPPTIDGRFNPFATEWPADYVLKILDQQVDATLYIMNNSQFVYMMVDAASIISMMDTTEDTQDHCTIYLYYSGKGIRVTVFGDNTKFCESTNSPGTPLLWNPISCPSGLNAAPGFGSSPDTPSPDHRMYEFRIPLNTIGAAAGDTIYFASPFDILNSLPFDYNGGASRYNIWPPSATTSDLSTWGSNSFSWISWYPDYERMGNDNLYCSCRTWSNRIFEETKNRKEVNIDLRDLTTEGEIFISPFFVVCFR